MADDNSLDWGCLLLTMLPAGMVIGGIVCLILKLALPL